MARANLINKPEEQKTNDKILRRDLEDQINKLKQEQEQEIQLKKARIDSLWNITTGYPVEGPFHDTLFLMYAKLGTSTPQNRAQRITEKIRKLYADEIFSPDALRIVPSDITYDIMYGELPIMSISESDALWHQHSMEETAPLFRNKIVDSVSRAIVEHSFEQILQKILKIRLILLSAGLLSWLVAKGKNRLTRRIMERRTQILKGLSYRGYTFLTPENELKALMTILKGLK